MAGNSQMNDNERSIFALNGITGMLIAVVLVIVILIAMMVPAVSIQSNEARNYYTINQDLDGLKTNSNDHAKHYRLIEQ